MDSYETLNERQKAFVDIVADLRQSKSWNDSGRPSNNQFTHSDINSRLEEEGYSTYSKTTIWKYKDSLGDIIEERIQMVINDRTQEEGEVREEDGSVTLDYTNSSWGESHLSELGETGTGGRKTRRT